ncbi:MAG TPA: ATP-grasp domain-containing protein [Gracilimonas sp.]|uniref:carboxylate--amine ligase n=1 Tax=Gracilimonas sp. TaxID=1974203 RepID=UPI002DA795B4|nr:ATP-grasp domain-containing protein [Gracilimonas sp.]
MNTKNNLPPVLACSEIGVVQCLGKAGIPVHSGSFFNDNPALYSKYVSRRVPFSTYTSEKFIDELCEYGKSIDQKAVFISDDDRAILLFSEHRERLEPYFHFLMPEKKMVEGVLDKRKFCNLSREYGLPSPVSFFFSTEKEYEEIKNDIPFPCIIKPAFKQDWWDSSFLEIVGEYKKAYTLNNLKELDELYAKLKRVSPRAIIQEFIPGDDDHLYSLNMYVNKDGELKGIYIAQKRRIYPIGAGTGCYVVTVHEEEIVKQTINMVKKLNFKGLVNVQFKKHSVTGEPKIMEIHVRNSFWNYLGAAAGMNLAALYYKDLTGSDINYTSPETPVSYKKNVAFMDLGKDIKAFLQYKRAGQLTFRDWASTYKGDFVTGGNLVNDPLPIIKNIEFILKRKIAPNSINH